MAEMKKYTGGCHCGKSRYEVSADLNTVIHCNCSLCEKRGLLIHFVPPEHFKLLSGEGALTDYRFNTKRIEHLFCPSCGVESFARGTGPDGKQMYAVNVRCLDGIDLKSLTLTPFDGRSR